jgi:hypothetical protein
MRSMALTRGVLVLVVFTVAGVGVGCSGGSSGSADGATTTGSGALDCTWTEGNNCWKTTAAAATSCLPPVGEDGALSADNSTCTYTSGAVITFDPPLVFPMPSDPNFNFTITTGGQVCLQYADTSAGFTLTVGGQTVTEKLAGVGIDVSCPDGTSYATSNGLNLLDCDGGTLGGLPGREWSSGTTSLSLGLLNTSMSSTELELFSCAKS